MSMVTTPVLSIMLNGSPTEAFNATRGLKQGDPLSPFLFILAAEGLRSYINAKVRSEQYTGLRLWGNDLPSTRQQFVDNVMMYGQASLKEAMKIIEILTDFNSASGMNINKDVIIIGLLCLFVGTSLIVVPPSLYSPTFLP